MRCSSASYIIIFVFLITSLFLPVLLHYLWQPILISSFSFHSIFPLCILLGGITNSQNYVSPYLIVYQWAILLSIPFLISLIILCFPWYFYYVFYSKSVPRSITSTSHLDHPSICIFCSFVLLFCHDQSLSYIFCLWFGSIYWL